MRILVVDSNVVFAKKVGEFLNRHLLNAEVDYASNVPVLRRRLKSFRYDFIIADILTAFDAKSMYDVLSLVSTPMIVWSVLSSPDKLTRVFRNELAKRIVFKPSTDEDLERTITSVSELLLQPAET